MTWSHEDIIWRQRSESQADNMVNMMTLTTKSPGDATTKLLGWKPETQLWETQQPSYWGWPWWPSQPGLWDLNSQAAGDEHDDFHNQGSVSRRTSSQVTGVETQVSASRRPSSQVTGGEAQSSDSEEFNIAQPPYCLEQLKLTTNRMAHSCKTNSGFTERLLLRNSSKDIDNSDKNFRKEVKVLEFMDKLKEVVKAENPKTVFHNNSTKSLESPQTPRIGGDFLGTCNQQLHSWTCNLAANWKKRKKNFFEELQGTGQPRRSWDWIHPQWNNNQ